MNRQILQTRRKIIQGFVGEMGEHRMDQNVYRRVEDDGVDLEHLQPIISVVSTSHQIKKNDRTLEGPRHHRGFGLKLRRAHCQCPGSNPMPVGNPVHIEQSARVHHRSL